MVYYEPYYSTSAEIKAAVSLQQPRQMSDIGRIYFKDGYLFINESGEGIHIIDNRNPNSPVPLSFLKIPGNYDLAIKGSTLYADSYVDLVAFDISDVQHIKEANRIERLFNNYTTMGLLVATENGILTEWRMKEQVNVQDCNSYNQPWGGMYLRSGIALMEYAAASFDSKAAFAPISNNQTGVGGSMARFTINGDYLYGLDGANMDVVNISESKPIPKNEIPISWDAETLFPYEDKLFVGSRTGMYILNLNNPENPGLISQYAHVRSCDPVVVNDHYAYVTLRSGTVCEGFINQLEVIDLSNIVNPSLVSTYSMNSPFGLGIDDTTLFICDGDAGLKIYDASDVYAIDKNMIKNYKDINAFDIIPYQKIAMMIGEDGLYQYDYSDLNDIKLISQLPIVNQ
jgi:hypothetical protein